MSIRWDSESDWKDNQDSSGTTGQNGELKQGYSRDKPPLSQDLVGYWPLHDESATDYSGNGNHGNLNGGVTTGVAGKGGLQAMSFDGSDDYVRVSDSPSLRQTKFTVCGWFYPTNNDRQEPIVKPASPPEKNYRLMINSDGAVNFGFDDTSGVGHFYSTSTTVTYNEWNFLAGVYDGSELRIYVNSSMEKFAESSTPNTSSGNPLYIGSGYYTSQNNYYGGSITNIRIYPHALLDSEIQKLYEWGSADLASPQTDGVARYPLDGNANDVWGSNGGTNNGATFVSDAIRGQATNFDGADDYIDIPKSVLSYGDAFSVSLWFNTSDGTTLQQLWEWVDSNRRIHAITVNSERASDGEVAYSTYDGSTWVSDLSGTYPVGGWTHVVATWDGSSAWSFYINAQNVSSSGGAQGSTNQGHRLGASIGNISGSIQYFSGTVDDVRIYDYALKPHEVFELYRWGTKGRDMKKQLVTH